VDALVLAGGSLERDRFPSIDASIAAKAALPILGRPMVDWVFKALRQTPGVERIAVVGAEALLALTWTRCEAELVPERGEIAANLRAGLEALPGARRVLAVSADLPLLTAESITDLMENAPGADAVFPFVERADALRAFPDREWMFARTPEGAFTGSALGLLRPAAVLESWPWVEGLLDARRRSVFGLAAMIGPLIAMKYLLRRLRVSDVEARLSTLLHLEGRGYRSRYAEIAMDVDKETDLPFVEAVLRARGG
jgi:GTP:adenosylcobinamide-phosphate guanylyltransferase